MGEKKRKDKLLQEITAKKTMIGTLDRAAYHEAGHAVMDILLGLQFIAVSLATITQTVFLVKNGKQEPVSQVSTEGVKRSEEQTVSLNEELITGKLDLREMISYMAGSEAEEILIGERDDELRLGRQDDYQGIVACCRAAISPGVPIENWKHSVMEAYIVNGVAMQAKRLLMDNWSSVQSVARCLLERKNLTYAEVEECMRTNVDQAKV